MNNLTKREASTLAAHLLRRLKGRGWKVHMFENQGWHYRALHQRRNLMVWPDGDGAFRCHLHPSYAWWTEGKSYRDPNMAVARAISFARRQIAPMVAVLEAAAKP